MNKRLVQVRKLTLGDGMPKICIPITAAALGELKDQAERILKGPCDLVEWRADYYENVTEPEVLSEALHVLRDRLGEIPLLFTFRTKEEGGECEITLEKYEKLNELAAVSGLTDLIDVELNRGEKFVEHLIRMIQKHDVRTVCSFHDFQKTPEEKGLIQILEKMQSLGADVTKVAVMPQSRLDVLRLLHVSVQMEEQYADRPFITMSMSRLGSISRIAGSFDGSAVTFATAGRASAPGQLEAEALAEILKLL